MKRFLTAGVLSLCLLASQMAHAAQDQNARIKAQMAENYLLWQNAYKNKDAERLISFESPDFTRVFDNGKSETKARNDEKLRQIMRLIRKVHSARVEIKKVSIEPNRVVVWNKQSLDADLMDGAREHRMAFVISTKDIWVPYDGIWMLKRVEELTTKVVVDGKTVSP